MHVLEVDQSFALPSPGMQHFHLVLTDHHPSSTRSLHDQRRRYADNTDQHWKQETHHHLAALISPA